MAQQELRRRQGGECRLFTIRTNDHAPAENVFKPPSLRKIPGAAAAQIMSASGCERPFGRSRSLLQGQDSCSAAPQVGFEPKLAVSILADFAVVASARPSRPAQTRPSSGRLSLRRNLPEGAIHVGAVDPTKIASLGTSRHGVNILSSEVDEGSYLSR